MSRLGSALSPPAKHVYLENPLGVTVAEAQKLLSLARQQRLQVGCSPDTFLGAAHQTAKKLIETGAIGKIVGGSAAVIDRGMEDWHPNPASFFAAGAGPVFDTGPYYLASLINLLGPLTSVASLASAGLKSRIAGKGVNQGKSIAIEVSTRVNSLLRFAGEVDIVFTASWDVWTHQRSHIEIYGTEGTLVLPDPNWYGGAVELGTRGAPFTEIIDLTVPFGKPNRKLGDGTIVADYRGAGLAEMAQTIRTGSTFRADGTLASQVLEAMEAIHVSAEARRMIDLG